MIMMLLPKNTFCGNTLNLDTLNKTGTDKLSILALANSMVADFYIRPKVTSHLNQYITYQLPIPRINSTDPNCQFLVESAARLVCTDEIYAPLWEEVMGNTWSPEKGITDEIARTRLRAEMDARIAHIYGLTEEEFEYVLSTFPAVDARHKEWALEEFRGKGL